MLPREREQRNIYPPSPITDCLKSQSIFNLFKEKLFAFVYLLGLSSLSKACSFSCEMEWSIVMQVSLEMSDISNFLASY